MSSDDRARQTHALDQRLAAVRDATAEIATMYQTLLREIGDTTVAMELTKTWIMSIAYHARPSQPPESPS
jgi:hypothetical protein